MKPLLTLHDPTTAHAYYEAGLWRSETLYALLQNRAAQNHDRFALRDASRRLTWGEVMNWSDGCAAALAAAGIDRGDRVSLLLSNRVECVIAFLACARQGYVCNPPLHRNYTVAQIVQLLNSIGAAALIAQEMWAADAADGDVFAPAATLPSMKYVCRLPANSEPGEFPAPGPAGVPEDNPDRVIYLAFTSGTTGTPKGVMHSENTLLANARAMVRDWKHDESSVLLSLSPLSHHIAWVAVAQWLVAGMELVVNDPPRGSSALDWIIESGATYVMGVPTHAMDILAEQKRRKIARIGKVTSFYMAGSPIPSAIAEAFLD